MASRNGLTERERRETEADRHTKTEIKRETGTDEIERKGKQEGVKGQKPNENQGVCVFVGGGGGRVTAGSGVGKHQAQINESDKLY